MFIIQFMDKQTLNTSNYGYPKIELQISKNISYFWVSIIGILDKYKLIF